MTKRISLATIIVIALVLTITTYAFAAANTMPDESSAGDGAVAISGYTVGAPRYTLGALDPSTITSVSFTIVPLSGTTAPYTTKVQLVSGGSWFTCTVASGTATCPVTGVTVLAADNFHVVAAD
jgi:hypothetical protein